MDRLYRHALTKIAVFGALALLATLSTSHAASPLDDYLSARDAYEEVARRLEATQLDGVLFMEGEGEPAEISGLKRELRATADAAAAIGDWLGRAMQASWGVAAALVGIDELADQIGERHRIIADDMQAAAMNTVIAHVLARAADVLDAVDFTPAALRADLAGPRVSARRIASAAELISHAADLYSDSAGLVHDNERRWRVFRTRVVEITGASAPPVD